MNILLFAEDFLLDGVTRHIVDLANGLAEAGHNVYVASTPSIQAKRLHPVITFVPLNLCYPESNRKRTSAIIQSLRILIRTIRENNINIIHTHKRYADFLGRIAARITGVKHLSTCHNEFNNYRWLSVFGDSTIAPSPEIATMLEKVFNVDHKRIKLNYNGIKPFITYSADRKSHLKKELNIERDFKILLSVGHLNRRKDRSTLIEAIHMLQSKGQFEKAVCLIVGEGEEYSLVQELIRRHDLGYSIKVLPSASDIEALNNIADFCVLSSLHEASPYVILEAASLGKPHIATAVGFVPSFMKNDEAGICVPPKNPRLLADAIYSLLSDPQKVAALGEKAYERFCQVYTYDRFIKNTISIYEEALLI